jgi:hypothetical protein
LLASLKSLEARITDAGLAGELGKGHVTSFISEVSCELFFERLPGHGGRMVNLLNHMWFFCIDDLGAESRSEAI